MHSCNWQNSNRERYQKRVLTITKKKGPLGHLWGYHNHYNTSSSQGPAWLYPSLGFFKGVLKSHFHTISHHLRQRNPPQLLLRRRRGVGFRIKIRYSPHLHHLLIFNSKVKQLRVLVLWFDPNPGPTKVVGRLGRWNGGRSGAFEDLRRGRRAVVIVVSLLEVITLEN